MDSELGISFSFRDLKEADEAKNPRDRRMHAEGPAAEAAIDGVDLNVFYKKTSIHSRAPFILEPNGPYFGRTLKPS